MTPGLLCGGINHGFKSPGPNGGSTDTHMLLPDSPALDAIPAGVCAVAIDQRGEARPQGDGCDIGAVERVVVSPPAGASLTPAPSPGGAVIAVWSGGTVDGLVAVAGASGCAVESVTANGASGGLVVYVPGAPPLVNKGFEGSYPGGTLPVAAVFVRCRG